MSRGRVCGLPSRNCGSAPVRVSEWVLRVSSPALPQKPGQCSRNRLSAVAATLPPCIRSGSLVRVGEEVTHPSISVPLGWRSGRRRKAREASRTPVPLSLQLSRGPARHCPRRPAASRRRRQQQGGGCPLPAEPHPGPWGPGPRSRCAPGCSWWTWRAASVQVSDQPSAWWASVVLGELGVGSYPRGCEQPLRVPSMGLPPR